MLGRRGVGEALVRMSKRWAWLANGLALGVALLVGSAPATAATAEERAASAECVECHDRDDLADARRGSHTPVVTATKGALSTSGVHAARMQSFADDPRTPSCVSCHGPSRAHLKKPEGKDRPPADRSFGRKSTLSPQESAAACLSCHQRESRNHFWAGSAHQSADVSCSGCHKVHTNHDRVLAKATQPEVCYACHKEQRAQLARASHHPVPEGKMSCSDCHSSHGSTASKLAVRDGTNATCYSCHAEKRGPFVHPHEPATTDCMTCHNPHGSSIPAMLKARAPMLCNQCHTPHVAGGVGALAGQPGVFTNMPGRGAPQVGVATGGKNVVNLFQGRSCMNCHTQVHGSNNPSTTGPAPGLLMR